MGITGFHTVDHLPAAAKASFVIVAADRLRIAKFGSMRISEIWYRAIAKYAV